MFVLYSRLVRRENLLGQQLLPIEALEEAVLLDRAHAVVHIAEALAQVGHEEMPNQRLGFPTSASTILIEALGEFEFALEDVVVDVHGVFVGEGVDASDHFVEEDAKGPPIGRLAVALVEEDLRREIFGRATHRERPIFNDFGEAEISDFEVAVLAEQKVLWFQVAVDNVLRVHMLEG